MPKFEKKQKTGLPDWMGTYGDLVTLLLCFFIMLFATSSVDVGKFDILLQAFNPSVLEHSGGNKLVGDLDEEDNQELSEHLSGEVIYQSELKGLEKQLNEFIQNEKIDSSVDVIRDSDKVTLRFNSSMLFDSAQASLKDKAKVYLKKVSKTLPSEFDIQIEGHTDNLAIRNVNFKSNWDLSAFRAINVLQFLTEECNLNPKKMSVAGYGEHRPIESNKTELGRSKNRRVDVVLFKPDGNKQK